MSRSCRGKLLLICNYDFYSLSVDGPELSERRGADTDIDNISTLFRELQFHVISHTNLTAAVITVRVQHTCRLCCFNKLVQYAEIL